MTGIPIPKIKICGLTRPEDIMCVNRLLPEYVGFVFAEKSRRYVTEETAALLSSLLDERITPVGVFVDAPAEQPARLLAAGIIRAVQLHGHEDEKYIAALRKLTVRPLIKACSISCREDAAAAIRSSADHILFDSGSGGTGCAFDTELISGISRPFFLAGGLDPGNVRQAIDTVHPFAVDVSSGVETNGKKDPEKIREFIKEVHNEK